MKTTSARILIDGTMARGGGGFTYLVNIVPELTRLAPDDRFRLLVRSERVAGSISRAANLEVDLLAPAGLAERLWFTGIGAARIAARWKADIYFSAGEGVPLRAPCPTIAAFRNLTVFKSIPSEAPPSERFRILCLRSLAKLSTLTCSRVMFVSEDSAKWIGNQMGLDSNLRTVIHHGIGESTWQIPLDGKSRHPRPYVLSVGSIYRYKNFVRLIQAYGRLARGLSDLPDLVIIGDDQDGTYSAEMRAARDAMGAIGERIHILGEVPYSEIPAWYRGAELFVLPSYLETFGHPLLEAMAAEVPVLAADIPVFRELAADAALYADPFDVESIGLGIEAALRRPALRRALVERGRERVKLFTWQRSAARLLGMFSEVLSERPEARLSWQPIEHFNAA